MFTIIGFLLLCVIGVWLLIGAWFVGVCQLGEPDKKAGIIIFVIAILYWYFLLDSSSFKIVLG